MKIETLSVIQRTFEKDPTTLLSFVEYSGLVCLASLIVNQEGAFENAQMHSASLALMVSVFAILTDLFQRHPDAKKDWHIEVGYPSLQNALRLTKIIGSPYAKNLFHLILTFIVGDNHAYPLISKNELANEDHLHTFKNPEAISPLLFELLPDADEKLQLEILTTTSNLIKISFHNKVESAKAGTTGALIRHYSFAIAPARFPSPPSISRSALVSESSMSLTRAIELPEHPFQEVVFSMLLDMAPLYITSDELRDLFALFDRTGEVRPSPRLLNLILTCVKRSRSPDYIQFHMTHFPHHGSLIMKTARWPPVSGFTFSCWLKILNFDGGSNPAPLELFDVVEEKSSLLTYEINSFSGVLVVYQGKNVHEFGAFRFRKEIWYHVVIVHSKGRMTGTSLSLFVDGIHVDTIKFPYLSAPNPNQSGVVTTPMATLSLGTPSRRKRPSQIQWNLGPAFLLEESLNSAQVNAIYNLGPHYSSNFQGPLTKYYTNEVIDSINLEVVGKVSESTGDPGHAIFQVENLLVAEDKILFFFHPHNLVKPESLKDVNPENLTSATFGTPPRQEKNSDSVYVWNTALVKPSSNMDDFDRCGLLSGNYVVLSHNDFSESVRKIGGLPVIFKLIELSDVSSPFLFFPPLGVWVQNIRSVTFLETRYS